MIKVFLIGYGLVVAAVVVFQRRMLYFPERFTSTIAETRAKETGFVAWRNVAGEIVGWKMPATGVATASVLITHGNGGSAMDRGWIAETIQQARNVDERMKDKERVDKTDRLVAAIVKRRKKTGIFS